MVVAYSFVIAEPNIIGRHRITPSNNLVSPAVTKIFTGFSEFYLLNVTLKTMIDFINLIFGHYHKRELY